MPTSKSSRFSGLIVLSLCLVCSTLAYAQGTGGRILAAFRIPAARCWRRASDAHARIHGRELGGHHECRRRLWLPAGSGGHVSTGIRPGGFKKSVQRGVNVDLNQVVTANSVLQVGATKETVEVTSEAPLVDTTSTQLGAIMDARQVANLPLNTRDTYQLLQLQPGVMSTVGSSNNIVYGSDDAGAVSVNGGRGAPTTSA